MNLLDDFEVIFRLLKMGSMCDQRIATQVDFSNARHPQVQTLAYDRQDC